MRIGIFLGYAPGSGPELTSHGLGRYLAGLLKGILQTKHEVVIACPYWLEKYLGLLCDDHGIDVKQVKIITVSAPIGFDLADFFLSGKKKAPAPRSKFRKIFFENIFKALVSVAALSGKTIFVLMCILLLCVAILSAPLLLLIFVGFLLKGIGRQVLQKPRQALKKVFSITYWNTKIVPFYQMLFSVTRKPFYIFYIEVLSQVRMALVRKINRMNCADIWFSPAMHWPEFNHISGPRVIVAPDLVTSSYPHGFACTRMLPYSELIRKTIENGDHFITYCQYLKDSLLVKDFNKEEKNIRVVPHAVNRLDAYIDIHSNTRQLGYPENVNTVFARQRLNSLKEYATLSPLPRVRDYISTLDFTDIKYIFYSSQIRPHKNVLTLIKVYNHILRKKYGQVKLILTGNYAHSPEVMNSIIAQRLEYDVLSFSSVSSQLLASLYHCAELVVNPTLYEGGFPFTFSEGMSVGTPSVMSRIPQTEEVFNEFDGADDFLFDPYDWEDMAEKILYGLKHKEELYEKQLPIYEKLKERTWPLVAHEYVEAFEYFMSLPPQPPKRKKSGRKIA